MIIILVGSIGRFPVAGHAWINRQYLRGFQALGHEVFYLEDCGDESWVYDWDTQQLVNDLDYPARHVVQALEPIGLKDRWSYRAGDGSRGMTTAQMADACRCADLLLVRGAPIPIWREEYLLPRARAFLDVDPLFTQVAIAKGNAALLETVDHCDHLFTIAQRIGEPDCTIPGGNRAWRRTVSPVYLPDWPGADGDDDGWFTTVMQWSSYGPVEFEGRKYDSKKAEFPKFLSVARRTAARFRIAMTGRPPGDVDTTGWDIMDGTAISRTLQEYQGFIQRSRAEFSVAKHGYVASRCGWFSDRSACYLASGRPVIVQDTGLADWLPIGEGVLAFTDADQAVAAVAAVQADYPAHRKAARRIAETYFATETVLPKLLRTIQAPPRPGSAGT